MIEISHLIKDFKGQRAVNDITLTVERGDCFGFIGPNGAGKTTTIKMMATLLPPSSGEILIDGWSVTEDPERVKALIGYMPDHFGVYDGMNVAEYLDFFASAYRKGRRERAALIQDVMELTDLKIKKGTPIEVLSTGMRQRLCLAKTLLHDPQVLILDEPASGLDPRARVELKVLLRELSAMGKTIFISSHILPELADYCNKVGIIERGSLVASGPVEAVIAMTRPAQSFRMKVSGDAAGALALLKAEPGVDDVAQENGFYRITAKSGACLEPSELIGRLVSAGVRLAGFWELETNLEDVFMKITRGEVA